jgi:hypothetical protein
VRKDAKRFWEAALKKAVWNDDVEDVPPIKDLELEPLAGSSNDTQTIGVFSITNSSEDLRLICHEILVAVAESDPDKARRRSRKIVDFVEATLVSEGCECEGIERFTDDQELIEGLLIQLESVRT